MISRWQWTIRQIFKKLWFRSTLFAIFAVLTALASIFCKSMIPPSYSIKVGAEAVDNILNILASSMLAVTTFSLSIMVTAYGSSTSNVTPRATRLVVEDATTQNVLATFIGSFLFSLVGLIALNMGAYGEQGRIILFAVTLVVIALILITLLRWIQHLTSLGRVGETTAKVEAAAMNAFIARAKSPCLGAYPWFDNNKQPKGTKAVYPEKTGYIEHIDIARMASSLTGTTAHVYLIAQPGSFVHFSKPVMYVTDDVDSKLLTELLGALSVSDVRSFSQDPRFCLCVMSEIACRALSPAVNDPGTAIDVIGRGIRILSAYGLYINENCNVQYKSVHIAPISADDLLDDFFSPIARDGAGMREVQLRLLKGLGMIRASRPDYYGVSALRHAREAVQYIDKENYTETDKKHIIETLKISFSDLKLS